MKTAYLTAASFGLVLVLAAPAARAQTPEPLDSTVTPAQMSAPPDTTTPATVAPAPAAAPALTTTQSKPPLRDRIYFGGSVQFSLGGDVSTIGVYPMIAYKLTPKTSVGVEVGYEHVSFDDFDQSADNYGGSLFTRYRVLPSMYVHAEYQMVNYEVFTSPTTSDREWVPFFLLGGGVSRLVGARTWAYAEVLFDVLRDNNSPYDDWEPFVSVGVGVGF